MNPAPNAIPHFSGLFVATKFAICFEQGIPFFAILLSGLSDFHSHFNPIHVSE